MSDRIVVDDSGPAVRLRTMAEKGKRKMKMKMVLPGVAEFDTGHGRAIRLNLSSAKLRLSNIESRPEQYATQKAYDNDIEQTRAFIAFLEANAKQEANRKEGLRP